DGVDSKGRKLWRRIRPKTRAANERVLAPLAPRERELLLNLLIRVIEGPQRTVRVIVPLPPGTSTDLAARLFAEKLSARWHQPVVIENRQGADAIPAVSG